MTAPGAPTEGQPLPELFERATYVAEHAIAAWTFAAKGNLELADQLLAGVDLMLAQMQCDVRRLIEQRQRTGGRA